MDERAREVLKAVVQIHIDTGEPVGSRTVSKKVGLGLSPATIRNIMADLEDMGYLVQPHTSAGRVPTDEGYRYYVDNLLEKKMSPEIESVIVEGVKKGIERARDFEDLLKMLARFISKFSDQIGLVFIPRLKVLRIKSVEFIRLGERTVLVVFASESGVVQHKIIRTDQDFSQKELNRFSDYINRTFSGKSLKEIKEQIVESMKEEKKRYDVLYSKAFELSKKAIEALSFYDAELHIEGTTNILNYREFAENVEKLKEIFKTFEEKSKIVAILDKCLEDEGVSIIIGKEANIKELSDLSLIVGSCLYKDRFFGTLGVVAPKRVNYSFVVPVVERVAQYIREAL